MNDNTNNNDNNKTRRRIIEIIIIIIILLLLMWSCKSGLLGGKGDKGNKGKSTTPTKVQEEVQETVYPSAIGSLVYNGSAQALVYAGKAGKDGASFEYALNPDGPFSGDVPRLTDAGSYTVYWRYVKDGTVKKSGEIPVSIAKAQDKGTVVGASFAEDGEPHNLIASATSKFGAVFEYSLDGETYSTTIPQKTDAGTYKVYWRTVGNSNYKADSGSVDVTVAPKVKPELKVEINKDLVYNGKDQRLIKTVTGPAVTTEYSLDGENWTEDYNTILGKVPGEYTVYYKTTATPKYAVLEGSETVTIAKAKLGSIDFNETLPYKYDGEEKTVTIKSVWAGKEGDLVKLSASDYDVDVESVFSATAVGTYKVTVTAKSDSDYFTGSIDGSWVIERTGKFGQGSLTIADADGNYSVGDAEFVFTGNKITPKFKVVADGTTLELGKDYEIVTAESTTSASDAGTYTIKVKGIGTYNYAECVATATWEITPISIGAVTFSPTEFEYSGEARIPDIVVKNAAGTVLTKDTDYTVTYYDSEGKEVSAPKEIGDYTAKITGIGNYTGEDKTTVSWTITADYVARIGTQKYASLEAALEAVPVGKATTIVMLDPVENDKNINVPTNIVVVIDFDEYAYTFSEENQRFIIPANSTVTMKDGDISNAGGPIISNKGILMLSAMDVAGTIMSSGTDSNITLQSGTVLDGQLILGTSSSNGGSATVDKGATVDNFGACAINVNGGNTLDISGAVNGRVETTAGDTGAMVITRDGATITAASFDEEGALTAGSDVAIYMASGELDVLGGTITGTTAVYFKSSTLRIAGGFLNGIGDKQSYLYKADGYNATGDALVVDKCSSELINPRVSGGYFYSKNADPVGSYAGNGQTARLEQFVAGGLFNQSSIDLNKTGLVAESYIAKVTTDSTYVSEVVDNVIIEYTVSTGCYGYDESGDVHTDIGTVTMNPTDGKVVAGNSVTLTADTSREYGEDVYRLAGWATRTGKGTTEDPYKYTSLSDDASGTYTYTPLANVTVVAKYVLSEKTKYHLTVNADLFSVDYTEKGEDKHFDGTETGDYDVTSGTEVTVTYKGTDIFQSWENGSNKVMCEDKVYTFKIGSQTVLNAITRKLNEKTVEFMTADKQTISRVTVNENTISTLTLPQPPAKSGYVFSQWAVYDGNTKLSMITSNDGLRQIVTEKFATASSFSVIPTYSRNTEEYLLTIVYPDGTKETTGVTKDTTVKVKASADVKIEGKVFSFWSNNADGTGIFAYNDLCSVYMNKDRTIYANYEVTAADKKPVVTLIEDAITENSANILKLSTTWNVPEGYTMIEYGILYSANSTITESELTTANQSAGLKNIVKKYVISNLSQGTNHTTFTITGYENSVLRARGYIIYKKDGTADTVEIYTSYFENSWNGVKAKKEV